MTMLKDQVFVYTLFSLLKPDGGSRQIHLALVTQFYADLESWKPCVDAFIPDWFPPTL